MLKLFLQLTFVKKIWGYVDQSNLELIETDAHNAAVMVQELNREE